MTQEELRDIANLTSSEYDSEYVEGWVDRLDSHEVCTEVRPTARAYDLIYFYFESFTGESI
jgi:hypothetical protein